MAVTVRHLPFRQHSTYGAWIKELAAWLSGVQIDTYLGPGWSVIEADDGVTRATPVAGTTVDHLPAGHLWRTDVVGEPPSTSWIVLQSLPGVVPPNITCQVYLYITSSTRVIVRMFVESNFVTGGGMGAGEPDLPATEIGNTTIDSDDVGEVVKYYAVADESVLIMGWLNEATEEASLFYVGEMDAPVNYGGVADDYPFVIRLTTETRFRNFSSDDDRWARHHPGKLGTVIGVATDSFDGMMVMQTGSRLLSDNTIRTEVYGGAMLLSPWMMIFPQADVHSWVRHVYLTGSGRGRFGMTVGNRFLMVNYDQANPALMIRWDDTTGLTT
jgi:hypothetical protein